jgi:PIN domain nuclease of toxin-antitoxin system
MKYVLDACAILAFLDQEAGGDKVYELFRQAEIKQVTLYMNIVNVMEVTYNRIQKKGSAGMKIFTEFMEIAPIHIVPLVSDITAPIFQEASRFKAQGGMSLADAILLATASCNNATVVTADHHELDIIEKNEHIPFFWIRPAPVK